MTIAEIKAATANLRSEFLPYYQEWSTISHEATLEFLKLDRRNYTAEEFTGIHTALKLIQDEEEDFGRIVKLFDDIISALNGKEWP